MSLLTEGVSSECRRSGSSLIDAINFRTSNCSLDAADRPLTEQAVKAKVVSVIINTAAIVEPNFISTAPVEGEWGNEGVGDGRAFRRAGGALTTCGKSNPGPGRRRAESSPDHPCVGALLATPAGIPFGQRNARAPASSAPTLAGYDGVSAGAGKRRPYVAGIREGSGRRRRQPDAMTDFPAILRLPCPGECDRGMLSFIHING